MKTVAKVAIAGSAGAAIYGLVRALRAKAEPEEPKEAAADIAITIVDSAGVPVPQNSPAILLEGSSYTARVTVTNRSTRAGTPIAASLMVRPRGFVGVAMLIFSPAETIRDYPAGGGLVSQFNFAIPDGYGGQTGAITAEVYAPGMLFLVSAEEPITVETMEIIYAATVTMTI